VVNIRQYLIENRLLPQADEADLVSRIEAELAEAVRVAGEADPPDDPMPHVYARVVEPGPGATEVEPAPDGPPLNRLTAINRSMHGIMEDDPDAIVFGEDVAGRKGGV